MVAFAACSSKHSENAEVKKELLAEKIISKSIFNCVDSSINDFQARYGNIPESKFTDKEKIIKIILDLAKSGKAKVYNWIDDDKLLTKEDIENILARKDTLFTENAETGKTETVSVISEVTPESIGYIKFEEDWSFNAEKMTFEKVVRRVCLGKAVFSESGELKGFSQLFWVEFNH